MVKIVEIVAIAVLAIGSGAVAQTTSGVATVPSGADTQVTVKGKRLHPCRERDQACIQDVIAEAWKENPQKVDGFCVREEWRMVQQHMTAEAIAEGGAFGSVSSIDYDQQLPPAERALCEYGAKLRAAKKLAAGRPSAAEPPAQPSVTSKDPIPSPPASVGASEASPRTPTAAPPAG
jgi:hypothetical protein